MAARRKWTKEKILEHLQRQKDCSWSYLRKHNPSLLSACENRFGSLRKAVGAAGLDYDEARKIKPVNKKWVIREIHSFAASGDTLSSLYTTHSALMRKSNRLFGSLPAAFRAAGYRYSEFKRNTGHESKWPTKDELLSAIRELPATYQAAVHRNHRGLMERAEKLFGSWRNAVEAAGLRFRHTPPPVWPAELILKKIRRMRDKSHGANYGTRLYYSARTAFGSWRYAVELAGFPYFEVEPRFRWRPEEVLYYIRWLGETERPFSGTHYPELYKQAMKYFGSWRNTVRAAQYEPASIHFKHRLKRPREAKSNAEIARELE